MKASRDETHLLSGGEDAGDLGGGRDLYTVRLGPFPSMADAAEAATAARERLGVATVIRFRPKPAPVTAPAAPPVPSAPPAPEGGAKPAAGGGEGGER